MESKAPTNLTYNQIIRAVKDVERRQFGEVIIKVRHGKASFLRKNFIEQEKLGSRETND